MVREWTGEHFSRQHHPWQHDRFPDQAHDDNRYVDSHDVRRPPIVSSKSEPHPFFQSFVARKRDANHASQLQGIDQALREHCNIPAKAYFVGVVLDNGTTATFSGPNRIAPGLVNKFFDEEGFSRCVEQVESGGK